VAGRTFDWHPELICRHDYETRSRATQPWSRRVFKPDGYFRLNRVRGEKADRHFFVEIDMGHMSQNRWLEKLDTYQLYAENRMFSKRYAADCFQTLVVTSNVRRCKNLRSLIEDRRGECYLLTTFEALRDAGAFSRIWMSSDVTRKERSSNRNKNSRSANLSESDLVDIFWRTRCESA